MIPLPRDVLYAYNNRWFLFWINCQPAVAWGMLPVGHLTRSTLRPSASSRSATNKTSEPVNNSDHSLPLMPAAGNLALCI